MRLPSRPSFRTSPRPATPTRSEQKTKGTMTILMSRMKSSPIGESTAMIVLPSSLTGTGNTKSSPLSSWRCCMTSQASTLSPTLAPPSALDIEVSLSAKAIFSVNLNFTLTRVGKLCVLPLPSVISFMIVCCACRLRALVARIEISLSGLSLSVRRVTIAPFSISYESCLRKLDFGPRVRPMMAPTAMPIRIFV